MARDAANAAAPLRVGLVAPLGAMGARVRRLLAASAPAGEWTLAAALVRDPERVVAAQGALGPSCLVTYRAEAFAQSIDVAVDFSAPAVCAGLAPVLAAHRVAYVVASTGLDAAAEDALEAAAARCPVLVAANTSLGVHVLAELVQWAAAALPDADVEVVEVHHRRKRDAPSGTALLLGEAVGAGRRRAAGEGESEGANADGAAGPGVAGTLQAVFGRGPHDPPRQPNELGYSAVRGGDVVGEHTVWLLVDGERLELTHRCTNADTFARGALAAARWLAPRAPGRYTMAEVLGRGP